MRAFYLLIFALFLSACPKTTETDEGEIDADGDGWAQHVDCDDDDPDAHPEAVEVCDGVDNNCDGSIDEGVTSTYYEDADLDGYGNPDAPVEACTTAEGLVNNDVDCDDSNALTNPYAPEICDYEDNDCDTLVDENVTTTFWMDTDGDGYGDPDNTVEACDTSQEGVVDNDDDCVDTNDEISPDADEICDDIDNDCDGIIDEDDAVDARAWYLDADGDGYGDPTVVRLACEQPLGHSDNDWDCDDAAPTAYPGGEEVCDELDNDCDGTVDEDDATDAPTWYADSDGDGWGDDAVTVVQCDEPSGEYSSVGEDCDDSDADVNPDADEVCGDSVDNDCDGDTDDGSAVDADVYYIDFDGDGYGWASTYTTSCDEVSGFVSNDEDCDDTDSAVNPDADEECDDGVDNDCDGNTDDSTAVDAVTYYADTDGDGYGDSASPMAVCETNVPTGYVDDGTDCNDSNSGVYPGAPEYCDGTDEDCDGDIDNDPVDGDTYYADSDGDGYGDASTTMVDCSAPTGYVSDDTDCDDTDAAINPDTVWYYDADLDGYGDTSTSYTRCTNPGGTGSAYYVLVDEDCDNYDANTYPGATEICVSGCSADGDDNDCDGTVDNGCPEIHSGTISADETWAAADDHYVACDLYVQGSGHPTLTIEDGAAVEFASGSSLRVAWSTYGDVAIQGTTLGVEFTAANATSGSYDGLYIGYYATGSTVEGLTISDAGGNSSYPGAIYIYYGDAEIIDTTIDTSARYGLYINSSEVLVEGTTIQNGDDSGVFCAAATCLDPDDASFIDNVITNNDGYPIVLRANNVSSLDASSAFMGNTNDFIHILSGTVSETTSWQVLDVPYYVDSQIYVQGGSPHPKLTLEDGVEIQFDSDAGIRVGWSDYGDLIVEGTSDGVLMTSAQAEVDRDLGDWVGLGLHYYTSSSTTIDGLTLEYAGASSSYPGGLYLYNPNSLDITDSSFQYNENHGVYASSSGGATFENCTFEGNELYGLNLTDGSRLEGDFLDNTLATNGSYAISLPAYYLDLLDTSSSFAGNTDDYIRVTHHSAVDADATWAAHDVPYHVVERLYINDSSGPVVTIADDSQWYFNSGTGIWVGYSTYGDLVVDGDSSDGTSVLFSAYDGSTPGKWDGIVFNYYTTGLSSMAGFELEYAGGNSSYQGGLYVYYTELAVSDCVITDNRRWGIYGAGYADLEISDCSIENTEASSLSSNGDGIYLNSNSVISAWSGNTVTGNERYPINIPANELTELDDASAYSGNGSGYDYVYSYGGTVTDTGTWAALDVPYLIDGNVSIHRTTSTATSPTITVEDAEVYMGLGHYIHVGYSNYGDLVVDNSTFTSQRDITGSTPSNGDWGGIWLNWYVSSSTSITNSDLHYAGGNSSYQGAIYAYVNSTSPTISGNDIAYSQRYGIYCASSTYCQYMSISGNSASGTNTSGNYNSYCPGW